ncbi:MAG TPA: hypothetical protein VGR91_13770 [Stellaceae bacterium]|nr:hypothetical protein [Stellaceae bacterium]
MGLLRIVIATLALVFTLGGAAQAHGGGHGGGHSGHGMGRVSGHHFAGSRSNRGGLRRGHARAAFVHRLNAARHTRHTTRLASREEHGERNAKEERHEKNAKEEHHEKAAKEEHHEQAARGDEDHGGENHGGEGD